jgi:hypothetical protein
MEKFSLKHIVLYSKGWYKSFSPKGSRKTIWDDLEILIEADGYLGCLEGDSLELKKNRITYLILSQFDRIPKKGHRGTLTDFYESIKPHNCFKFGYYTEDYFFAEGLKQKGITLEKYDYNEAVVRYCLSYFSNLSKDEWQSIKPDFSILPKNNGVKDKSVKKIFSETIS